MQDLPWAKGRHHPIDHREPTDIAPSPRGLATSTSTWPWCLRPSILQPLDFRSHHYTHSMMRINTMLRLIHQLGFGISSNTMRSCTTSRALDNAKQRHLTIVTTGRTMPIQHGMIILPQPPLLTKPSLVLGGYERRHAQILLVSNDQTSLDICWEIYG